MSPQDTIIPGSIGAQATKSWESTDLVRADDHSLHSSSSVQGCHSHQSNDGRAVRVCNDAPLACLHALHGLRVDFWDDQGYALLHAECRAVVHHLQRVSCY